MYPMRTMMMALVDSMGSRTLKHFKIDEFKCSCCGMVTMDGNFLAQLDEAREIAGTSFVITSGFRCEKHNRDVGGSPQSSHLHGKAADIAVGNSAERFRIIEALTQAGFSRIGIAKTFIHVDNDNGKPHPVAWVY